jgi:asparagine synthase (glutamine-hydrolysing)
MCGIVCALTSNKKAEVLRPQVLEMSKIIRHRGPDWRNFSNEKRFYLMSVWLL